MTEQLLKLAEMLLATAEKKKADKKVKCAKTAQAVLGLELLRQKIGG